MTDLRPVRGVRPVLFAAVLAASGVFAVRADELSLDAASGLNYETALVTPQAASVTEGSTLTLVASDPEAGVFTQKGLSPAVTNQPFAGLTAGRTVALDGYLVAEGVTNAAAHRLLVMGAVHDDGWIDETAETFTNGLGTGVWSGREFAQATNGVIQIDTKPEMSATNSVRCTFADVPVPTGGSVRGYAIDAVLTFPCPYSELPDATGQVLGVTVGSVDEENPNQSNFFYVENGGWTSVPVAACDPSVSTNWQIHISVDRANLKASYYARPSDDAPWAILGTAALEVGSVTETDLRGTGSLASLKGNGFDTRLIRLDVTFGDKNLYPGCNFEATIITGRVSTTMIHDTDRLEGQYTVRLTDLDGNVITNATCQFTVGGDMEFYIQASDLTAGSAYRADITLETTGEANEADASELAVMGRALTNELWGVEGLWVYENDKTFDGILPGTGEWSGTRYAWTTNDEWICVKTVSTEEEYPLDAKLSFLPTNDVGETVASYVSSIRAIFTEAAVDAEAEDAVYGMTVLTSDDGLSFLCLSNRVWQAVPQAVATPVLGVEYTLTVMVEKDSAILHYLLAEPDGGQKLLMTVDLDADLCREFECVDILGVGQVTDLSACVYSTELLRLHVDFDADALYPGTNFEASAANGVIKFEQLWETDHTYGNIRVALRDKYGVVIAMRRVSFHDLTDRDFTWYVSGLQPGETYSVDAVGEVKGIDSDSSYASGSMARVVTNGGWAVSNEWIREDVDTFAGRKTGTGVWEANDCLLTETNGFIEINTFVSDDESAHASFLATNALPSHTGFEIRKLVCFDTACSELPTVEGKYGMTIVSEDSVLPDDESSYYFAVIVNGAWQAVDPSLFEPRMGWEYELTIRVDYKTRQAYYAVRLGGSTDRPEIICCYDLADDGSETPYVTDYYGIGRVRTYEGDGFDVSLVEIAPELDEDLLTPGTNFASTVAGGVLRIRPLWLTDKTSGDFTITIRDAHGRIVAVKTVSYSELVDQDFNVPVEGLSAGETYDVEITATLEGDDVLSNRVEVVMARALGSWIRETPETFLGEETGTGLWSETNETAVVESEEGRAIKIVAAEGMEPVRFDPTNDTLSVRKSSLREIRFDVSFDEVGWYASETELSAPSNALAGVTVWCDDTAGEPTATDYALAVLGSNGTWRVLDETRNWGLAGARCVVTVRVDYRTGFVRYGLATETLTNRLYQYDFDPCSDATTALAFTGTGRVWSMDGDTWDSNLIRSSTNEFTDLDAAILGTAGTEDLLSPLWRADQLVTVGKGTFRIYDTNNWLNVRFPWWYYVTTNKVGDVVIYRFNRSNNWIDYAENGADDITIGGGIYFVKTAEGLSWIAAEATNRWISGRIELAADIDLSAHNWTPIAGFSGTFDGLGRTITGLNNRYHNAAVPDGEYMYGPTNAWGRSTYGLFGTATNATLTGVTFAGVSISNMADSVAALAGALAGNCAVSNVTVESGSILGLGGTAAGIAGFADFADFLTAINNTNRAAVAAGGASEGDGRWAAGLLVVAGSNAEPLGTLVVTNNVNAGTVSNAVYDTVGLLGGNVAQILAGTTPGARFGETHLTNNFALGSVTAEIVRSDANEVELTDFPAVNLASAIWGSTADGLFWHHLDANDPSAVAVDPVNRTARMLSDLFINGSTNVVGALNDRITGLTPGPAALVTMPGSVESWAPIVIDRAMTLDLGGHLLYTVYTNDTILISNGVTTTVRNGTIAVGPESRAFAGDTNGLTTVNLTIEDVPEDFYERTAFDLTIAGESYYADIRDISCLAEVLNSSETIVQLYEGCDVSVDVDAGELKIAGRTVAKLNDCYRFTTVQTTDGDGNPAVGFKVRIVDSAAPTVGEFSVTGSGSGTVSVTIENAKPGFYYAIQQTDNLAAEWATPEEWTQATGSSVSLSTTQSGHTGFYRVIMTDSVGGTSGDE